MPIVLNGQVCKKLTNNIVRNSQKDCEKLTYSDVRNQQTSLRKTNKQDCGKLALNNNKYNKNKNKNKIRRIKEKLSPNTIFFNNYFNLD